MTRWILDWPPWGLRGGSGCGCLAHAGLEKSIFLGSSQGKKKCWQNPCKKQDVFCHFVFSCVFFLKSCGAGAKRNFKSSLFSMSHVSWPLKAGKLAMLCRIPACRLMHRTILGHLDFLKNNGWWSEVTGGSGSCFMFLFIMKSQRISTLKGYWWIIWPLATEGSNLLYNFGTTNWVKSLSSTSNLQWLM